MIDGRTQAARYPGTARTTSATTVTSTEVADRGERAERVDDREAGDAGQRMAQQQLAVEPEHARPIEQPAPSSSALSISSARHSTPLPKPSTFMSASRGRRCQIIAPIAAAIASTAAISTSSAICVSRERPWRLVARCTRFALPCGFHDSARVGPERAPELARAPLPARRPARA